jgi:lipoprotein-releasing system permease protein
MKATHPFAPFEWMLALRYLRARRAEGFVSVISAISLIGIAIGVAALIIVMAVMNGFRHELLSRILGLQGHALVQGVEGPLPHYDAVAGRLRVVPGVLRAAPIVDGQLMATSGGVTSGIYVRGMKKTDLKSFTMVSSTLTPGTLAHFEGGDSVIIGARLAERMRLLPGDKITLIAPRGDVTPFGTTPRIKTYTVAGIFKIGMSEYDLTFVFMPLAEAQAFFNTGDAVTGIELMVKNPDGIDAMVLPLAEAAGPGARVMTWHDRDSTFFDAVQIERNVMALILSLIVVVAALNIISGLYMLVKGKSADIAILRTMGATRGAVMRVFIIAGLAVGVMGTLLGFLIGVLFCANIESIRQFLSSLTGTVLFNPEIYFLSKMPAEMDPGEVTVVVIVALVLSFLATLYPAWRAARLDPVEALRYE